MSKTFNRVTFEELADEFSHYEVAFLSFCRASDILMSANSLISKTPYKPKVALVAFDQICSDVAAAKAYKEELLIRFNSKYEEKADDEEYAIGDEEEEV